MGVGRGDGGARLGEHLVALQLLGLHGHLGITVLGSILHFELGNVLLDMHALLAALVVVTLVAGTRAGTLSATAGGTLLGLLLLNALLLRLNLRQEAGETARLAPAEHRSGTLGRRSRGGLRARGCILVAAIAQRFLDRLLLGHFLAHGGRAGTSLALRRFARNALLLGLNLMLQALKGTVGNLLHGRGGTGRRRRLLLASSTGALGLAGCALLLDRFAAGVLGFFLFALLLGALFGKLLRLFCGQLACALLDFGRKVLADLVHIRLSQHAGMALRRNLHLVELVEHFLARHIELLRQFMYTHAGHIPLLYSSLATRACAAISAAIRS